MEKYIWIAAITLAVWNLIIFVIYGVDKRKAKNGRWRISEKTLITLAVFMGGFGALCGMNVFRHKTKHAKFKYGIPLILIFNIVIGVIIMKYIVPQIITDVTPKYQKITPEAARKMMDDGGAVILDVRTAGEYEEIHIPRAILLPDTEIEKQALEVLPDKSQTILVYCRTGRRSKIAAEALVEMGYMSVYDFGGIVDWRYETVIEEAT